MQKIHKNSLIVLAVLILSVGIYFSIVRPAIIGYTVYDDLKEVNDSIEMYGKSVNSYVIEIEQLKNKVIEANANSSSYKEMHESMLNEIEKYSDKMVDYELEIQHLADTINEILVDIEESGDLLKERDKKIDDLTEDYENLAENAAKNICCKMKVDNSKIDSYNIVNNKIVCLESGDNDIEC